LYPPPTFTTVLPPLVAAVVSSLDAQTFICHPQVDATARVAKSRRQITRSIKTTDKVDDDKQRQ